MQHQLSLLPYNTFGLDARAEYFAECRSEDDIRTALKSGIRPVYVLGGGSNILFIRAVVSGLLIKNSIEGISILESNDGEALVEAGGGENWHRFVLWCIEHGLGGVENLSLIPGTVGAAPVQNIGAYGVELKDVFDSLEAVDLETGETRHFDKATCRFGYRDSIFKQEAKGRYCITRVRFRLTRHQHKINISYGDIRNTLALMGQTDEPGIADVSEAVVRIRSSKLPDPAQIGNCGSFFKNPEIPAGQYENLRSAYPDMPHYPLPGGLVKVPAGWLIEQCGWKGKRVGNTGSYEKQALVLVNYGGATGEEVYALALAIIDSVKSKFGISLDPEVNIW